MTLFGLVIFIITPKSRQVPNGRVLSCGAESYAPCSTRTKFILISICFCTTALFAMNFMLNVQPSAWAPGYAKRFQMYCHWLKHNDRDSQNVLNAIDTCECGANNNSYTFKEQTLPKPNLANENLYAPHERHNGWALSCHAENFQHVDNEPCSFW